MITGEVSGCTDKMYSGHTCLLFVSFLLWTRYARHWIFVVYSFVHSSLGIAAVLAVRIHYTVDVVLAIALTFLVHQFYYTMLELAVKRQPAASSMSSREYSLILPCHEMDVAGGDDTGLGDKPESIALDVLPLAAAGNSERRQDSNGSACILHGVSSKDVSIGPKNLLVNRMPLAILPRIVAWMDGLHLR
ncbi:hypothetical protein EV183_005382 [Coemansia sp. RSA 2336]|nr:hypothetical protein EV183_005382 [Coemansia sp. RSA 2336]